MISVILLGFIVPFVSFVFESYPRIINRNFGVDIWTHLLYLKEYHKQHEIPKKIENGFLVPGIYDYPPAFIFILSKFPFKMVEKYEFLFSPFFDSLHIFIIFFITFFLTSNLYVSLLTQVIYLLTPIIVLENSSATPRSLGYMLFTVVYMSLFLFGEKGDYIFLVISIFFGSLIFLSHRFTTQGFLFFSIFFTILTKNPLYLYAFFLSFIVAIIISRGFYLKVLRGHLGNLKFWKDNISYRYYHQVKGEYSGQKGGDFILKLYNQFLKFPPFVLAITNPWTLPVFYIALFSNSTDRISQFLILISLFFYFMALLTIWFKQLRFLGEGQRYLELCAFPVAFLSSKFIFEVLSSQHARLWIIFYMVLAVGSFITIIVIQRKGIIKDRLRTVTPDMNTMFRYLKSLKIKPKLLCIPHQITTNTIYHTGCPVFVNADYKSMNKISDVYPYLRQPVREIMKKYNLDMVFLNEDYAKINELKLKKFTEIKRINNYVLIRPQ